MKLEKILTLMILFFSISLYSQTSTIVKVTHKPGKTLKDGVSIYDIPNWQPISSSSSNCFSFLSFKVFVKAKSKDELMYKVEVSNSSSYSLELDCSKWGFGSGGRSTIRANSASFGSGSFTSSDFPTINFSNVNFTFPQDVQDNYGVSMLSNYIKCGETATTYLNIKKKEKDDKVQARLEKQQQAEREREAQAELEKQEQAEREKQKQAELEKQEQAEQEREAQVELEKQEQSSNTSKEKADNEKSENKSYQVLDVDTSAYEAEKARKRKLAEENRQQKTDQERRDREYKERKDAFEKEQLAKLNRSTQAYEQRQTNLQNAGNNILNAIDNMSRESSARHARENAAEEERYRQIKADREAEKARREFEWKEEKLRKQRERDDKKAEEEHKAFLRESRQQFVKSLENQNIPVQVSTSEVFFFMVTTEDYGKEIIFAPFKVLADENKQIPYGNEMIQDFYRKTGEYGYKIYGPFNSKYEQENAIKKMANEASSIEIIRKDDLEYEYVQKKKTSDGSSDTDFWGNKKDAKPKPKEPTEKKKKATSFWDN